MAKHTSIKKRREQAREQIIEDILQIARAMMQKDGVGALSFNAIARQLGIKPPSLYTYFDSKNAIYDALFKRGFILFGEAIQHDEPMAFADRLRLLIRDYMRFAYDNPDLFQIMFQRPIPDFVPSEESMAISLASLESAQDEIRQMFEAEQIDTGMPPEVALDLIISMMHGLASLHMANHPDLPVGEGRFGRAVEHAADLFLRAWQINSR